MGHELFTVNSGEAMHSNHLPRLLDKSSIGRVIRRIREGAGMTQQELGDYLNLSRGQGDVSRWEVGDAQPRAEILLQIAALAGEGMEAFQVAREAGRRREGSARVERDQALVDALLAAVGESTSLRDVDELTGIKYSTVNKWRRQPLKAALSSATRDAARAYLGKQDPQHAAHPSGNGAHAPHSPHEAPRVDALALLQGDDVRADQLVAAQHELARAFRIRAETIARLVAPPAPSAMAGRGLTPDDFAGGASAPEVELRNPAKKEDPPQR